MNKINWLTTAVLAVVIIILSFYLFRSCDVYDEYSRLQGLYNGSKEEAQRKEKEAQKIIASKETEISEKNSIIREKEEKIIELSKQDKVKNKDLKSLEDELEKLSIKEKIITNLKSQVKLWKERFSLAQKIINEKDEIIFSLAGKYSAQVEISEQWIARYAQEKQLRILAEERIKLCDKRLRRLSFTSRVEKIVIAGLVGYIAFKMIKEGIK